jgi:hypothetical protein
MIIKRINLDILTKLQVFSTTEYENAVFGLSRICLCKCICAFIAPVHWTHLIHSPSVSGEYEYSNSKNRGNSQESHNTELRFSQKGFQTILMGLQSFIENISLNKYT